MKTKQYAALAIIAVSAGAFLAFNPPALSEGSNHNQKSYKLEGAWIARVPGTPILWTYSLSPADPSGRRATISGSIQVAIPNSVLFPALFIGQEYISGFVGEAVMTGPDTANFTGVWYGLKKNAPSPQWPFIEQVVNIGVTSGQLQFTGPGKAAVTHHIAFYAPAADADGDGLPDAGQSPFLCLPATVSLDTRVGLIPPCNP